MKSALAASPRWMSFPILRLEDQRHMRGGVAVDERLILPQGLFEVRNREARVIGDKGAIGIVGFEFGYWVRSPASGDSQ